MRFCVCIKQVPDVSAAVQTGRTVLNAYDASAVEGALVLSEGGAGSVDLVLLGPASAKEIIRKALAMGADAAAHLVVPDDAVLDSAASAALLADYLRGRTYDVIACGKQSQDSDAGLAGGMIAEHLGLPFATNAVGLAVEGSTLVVTRQGDAGQEVLALPTPCLVTCSNDMNDPRIPSLKGIMGAKKKEIAEIETVPGRVSMHVLGLEPVPDRAPGRMLVGDPDELVRQLTDALANEAKVL